MESGIRTSDPSVLNIRFPGTFRDSYRLREMHEECRRVKRGPNAVRITTKVCILVPLEMYVIK